MAAQPFWQRKSLTEMTAAEWESLCDGCGKCCLHKFIAGDPDLPADAPMQAHEEVAYVNVACRLLDTTTGDCSCYTRRLDYVPDCVVLTPADLPRIHFMPASCAYRRLHEGRGLPSWHPLLHQGSRTPMRAAGMSVVGRTLHSDATVDPEADAALIVSWPLDPGPEV